MADSDDIPQDDEPSEYMNERQLVAARFIALGGGTTIDMDLAKMPKLADLITQQHRDMVKDLASYLPNEMVARIMGISKERLQTLFETELETGFHLAKASLGRAAYLKGVAGDVQAMALWLRNHNRSDWAQKIEKTDKGQEQSTAETAAIADAGRNLVNDLITAMSTSKDLFKRPVKGQQEPVKVVESAKPKPPKAGLTRTKVKGD